MGTGRKSKTGCRTCKIRHVKCDEAWPACCRCTSTGRVCDGYGIWGGGGNNTNQQAAIVKNATPKFTRVRQPLFKDDDNEQNLCLQWFQRRTSVKFPGAFHSGFWHTLVFQVSFVEPAVLHAVLALGSAHKRESLRGNGLQSISLHVDREIGFMIQQYNEAIRHLQPHFSKQNKRAVRVALAACAIFTCLESFLGNYRAAAAHLRCGLNLLAHHPMYEVALNDSVTSKHMREQIDDWITEVFLRLHVQAALIGYSPPCLYRGLVCFPSQPQPPFFESPGQANNYHDRLLSRILLLAEQCKEHSRSTGLEIPAASHECQKKQLLAEATSWLESVKSSKSTRSAGASEMDAFVYIMLRTYHIMAMIKLETCIWPLDESIYDSHTHNFLSLIHNMVDLWKAGTRRKDTYWRDDPRWGDDRPSTVCHSIGDKGWIPLGFFVATKCRVHRLRHQSVRLLAAHTHREGIWDSILMTEIAKEIIRVEEDDFYRDSANDEYDLGEIPTIKDTMLSLLPDSQRLHDLQVMLPDTPTGHAAFKGKRRGNDAAWETVMRLYDPIAHCWYDQS
ncbi:hypothetical protein F5Y15DRAFT_421883 [Xylariaceae sp. FL0016]|nr:hypothetical protein F5Y15DRAFT_421883 [Xylariaceae sp. FL0016]